MTHIFPVLRFYLKINQITLKNDIRSVHVYGNGKHFEEIKGKQTQKLINVQDF